MSDPARAAEEFVRLVTIMSTLRGPGGCPWDREQTVDTLKPFVLEETYEVLEAIDRHDHVALREELGDFLFEAVFLAQLESEAGRFTIADSLKCIADKLVRRHPHVFRRGEGEPALESPEQVKVRWEEIKAGERAALGDGDAPKTLLGGMPPALPALLRAYQIGTRAASVGFDWPQADDVLEKIDEEIAELREALGRQPPAQESAARTMADERAEEEMGDLLFAIANLARKLGIEPETALRKANDKFTRRFTTMERQLVSTQQSMREMTLEDLERAWQRVKHERL